MTEKYKLDEKLLGESVIYLEHYLSKKSSKSLTKTERKTIQNLIEKRKKENRILSEKLLNSSLFGLAETLLKKKPNLYELFKEELEKKEPEYKDFKEFLDKNKEVLKTIEIEGKEEVIVNLSLTLQAMIKIVRMVDDNDGTTEKLREKFVEYIKLNQ